ncbi:MAG: methyltransferase, partial [Candidatus Aegiribacteria sp.]|nr:methyltransferase [Candidatus Aegiribacteria sp.]MBD3295510.1 methyltransferase [Candidatus Fermentibacteria bacterium]
GGLIALDNVFRGGRVLNADSQDIGTKTIDKLNQKIFSDNRVDQTMIPVGDGLTLVRKR